MKSVKSDQKRTDIKPDIHLHMSFLLSNTTKKGLIPEESALLKFRVYYLFFNKTNSLHFTGIFYAHQVDAR